MKKFYLWPAFAFMLIFSSLFCFRTAAAESGAAGAPVEKTGFYLSPHIGLAAQKFKNVEVTLDGYDAAAEEAENASATGTAIGMGMGYDFMVQHDTPIRAEGVFTWRSGIDDRDDNTGDYLDMDYSTVMFNVFVDIPVDGAIKTGIGEIKPKPYVGGGFGAIVMNYDGKIGIAEANGSDSAIGFNLGAGVAIPLNDDLSIDLGYRYTLGNQLSADFDVDYLGTSNTIHVSGKTEFHDVLAGLRITF